MILPDVNVLVYAYRADTQNHEDYRRWLDDVVNGDRAYGMADLVLSAFLRIVTHPRIFNPPSSLKRALQFVEAIKKPSHCIAVDPGPRHWEIFTRLCRNRDIVGNRIPDAYLAALAIEFDHEWITTDQGFRLFPGLRWRHPLR